MRESRREAIGRLLPGKLRSAVLAATRKAPRGSARPRGFFLPRCFTACDPQVTSARSNGLKTGSTRHRVFWAVVVNSPPSGQSGFHIACRDASSQLLGTGPTAFEPATESHQRRAVGCRAKALLPSMASGDGDGKSWFQSWALFPRRRGNRASAHSSGSRNSRPKHNAATARKTPQKTRTKFLGSLPINYEKRPSYHCMPVWINSLY